MKMKRLMILFTFSFLFIFSFNTIDNVFSFASVSCLAKAMCVMESESKRVLYDKNLEEKLPMASTTKIMTAITAIESGIDLDEPFEISKKAVGIPGTSLYLKEGEHFTLRKLLYGLMLISGNDASVAIGERVSNGVEHFIDMMNWKAKQIGAINTHFENTHGLDEKGHYTTAYDLALITSYALKNDIFREIVSTKSIQVTNEDGKIRYFNNKNKLLHSVNGAIGVKTGFTDDAGRCLVSAVERDGMTVVCVVLNCGPMFEESASLLENAFSDFKLYDLTKNYDYPEFIEVEDGRQETVKISTLKNFNYPLKKDEIDKIEYLYSVNETVEAPVEKGDEIGEIRIFLDKELLFSEKIFTMEDIRTKGILQKIFDIISGW